MTGWLRRADDVLRGRPSGQPWGIVLACGVAYGAVMGTFCGVEGDRAWQVVYSASKVPLLLLATLLLSLPSYFVLNTLTGVRADFAEALRGVVASQAALAIVLVSLAPVTVFWYASTTNYRSATFFNGLMFAVATLGAQWALRRSYRPLIARDPRHRRLLVAWVLIYMFVGVQLSWTLRPFIGDPDKPVRFFRGGELENAYVVFARMAWEFVWRGDS